MIFRNFSKNKLVKFFFLICLCILSIFWLTGCRTALPEITSIAIKDTGSTEVMIDKFDLSDYTLVVSFSDGSTKETPVTDDMVDAAEYLNIVKHEGTHTLHVTYKNFSCTYDITVKQYEFTDIYITDQTVTYDGNTHSLTVEGNIPANTTIEFLDKNSYKNVGEYTITARLSNTEYVSTTVTGQLTINKADYDLSELKFASATYVYDGTEKEVAVEGLAEDIMVAYEIDGEATNKKTNAGTYTVKAHFYSALNFNQIPDMETTLTIEKATYDMSNYSFNDMTVTYTGEPFSMHITNESSLPAGVSVSYSGLDVVNAGTYTVKAIFTGDDNYNDIPAMVATLTINKAQVALTGVYMNSATVIYDGKEHSIDYSGTKPASILLTGYAIYNQEGVKIYDSNDASLSHKAKNAGIYTVYAYFSYRDTKNYAPIDPLYATLEIDKADITDIVIENESHEYVEDMGQSLTVSTSVDGVIATPSMANPVYPGDYEITYTFTLEGDTAINYNVPEPITRTLTITKKELSVTVSQSRYEYEYNGEARTIELSTDSLESKWVTPFFFTIQSGDEDTETVKEVFKGEVYPGTYLVFVEYLIGEGYCTECGRKFNEDDSYASLLKSKYGIDTNTTWSDVPDDFVCPKCSATKDTFTNTTPPEHYEDYYFIPDRESAYLIITPKTLTITDDMFSNRQLTYTGLKQTVTLDMAAFYEKNPGLDSSNCTLSYTNNTKSEEGYYTGTIIVTLSGEAKNYYTGGMSYSFSYAIRGTTAQNVIVRVLHSTYDYEEGIAHSVELSDMPDGITVTATDNELIYPGSKIVRFTFDFDNEVARWYYILTDASGRELGVNANNELVYDTKLIVNKISYDLSGFTAKTLVYNGTNQEVTLNQAIPEGVMITFDYTDEERINAGEYTYTMIATMMSDDMKKIYKDDSRKEGTFTIEKADYKFSFTGLNCKYDGTEHEVKVSGLDEARDEGLIDWTSTGNNQIEVGKYNVVFTFTNYSANYNNILKQQVTLVIDTSKTDSSSLIAYNTQGVYYTVKQFEKLSSIWDQLLDSEAYDISYVLDYYDDNSSKLSPDNAQMHITPATQNDYTFSEATTNNQFVWINYSISIKDGYVDSANNIIAGVPYTGNLFVKVTGLEKLDISKLVTSLENDGLIDQYQTLEETYLTLVSDYVAVSYRCEYFNSGNAYDDSYSNRCGENSFNFCYNTWGDRYVKLDLILTAPNGTYLYDGIDSYQIYERTFELKVMATTAIDAYALKQFVNNDHMINQFMHFEEILDDVIDKNLLASYSIDVYEDGVLKAQNAADYYFNKNDVNYQITLNLNAQNGLIFNDNNKTVLSYSFEVNINPVNSIDVGLTFRDFEERDVSLLQYTDYFDCLSMYNFPEGLTYTYTIIDVDGTKTTGTEGDSYQLKKYLDDLSTNTITVSLLFKPTGNNYVIVQDASIDEDVYFTKTITHTYDVVKVSEIDLSDLSEQLMNLENNAVEEYDNLRYHLSALEALNAIEGLTITNTLVVKQENAEKEFTLNSLCDYSLDLDVLKPVSSDSIILQIDLEVDPTSHYVLNANNWDLLYSKTLMCTVTVNNLQLVCDEDLNQIASVENQTLEQTQYLNIQDYIDAFEFSDLIFDAYLIDEVHRETLANVDLDNEYAHGNGSWENFYFIIPTTDSTIYKVSLTYNAKDNYVLNIANDYVTSYTFVTYFTVVEKEDVYDIATLASLTIPTYTQYDYLDNYCGTLPVPQGLSIFQIDIADNDSKFTYKSGTSQFLYDSTQSYKISIYYEFENYNYIFIEKDASGYYLPYEQNYYCATYDLTMKTLTLVDMDPLHTFIDDSHQYLQTGLSLKDYDLFGVDMDQVTVTYRDAKYSTDYYSYWYSASDVLISNYTYTLNYSISANEGYTFGEDSSHRPITSKGYTFAKKALDKAQDIDITYLQSLIQSGGSDIRTSTADYYPFEGKYEDTYDDITFTYISIGSSSQSSSKSSVTAYHLSKLAIRPRITTTVYSVQTWKFNISFSIRYSGTSDDMGFAINSSKVLYKIFSSDDNLNGSTINWNVMYFRTVFM